MIPLHGIWKALSRNRKKLLSGGFSVFFGRADKCDGGFRGNLKHTGQYAPAAGIFGMPEPAIGKEPRKTPEKCAEAVDFNMLKS